MRARMRTQLDGDPLKHGAGGLLDIDFLAQLGLLTVAPDHPQLALPRTTREQLRLLGELGWLDPAEAEGLAGTHRALVRARHLGALVRGGQAPAPDRTESQRICTEHGL